ncbi:MAG: phospholipid carrier-dependent glycosyltransferase, partial [Ardenticatenales bacterium]
MTRVSWSPAGHSSPLTRRLAAAAAVLLYLALGAAYARTVPPWEAPDEPWHAAYALAVADGRLPTVDETYEFHHPPLAYAWYALGIRITRIRSLPVGDANPRYPFAAAALAHPPGDPRVGPVRFLRTWGALLAALAVPLTFAAARAAGAGRAGGVAAAFGVATWPQFVYTGHTVSNDGLATVAGALLTYALVCVLARLGPRDSPAKPAWEGTCAAPIAFVGAAVAVATKLNAAVLVPVVVVAALAAAATARDPRRRAGAVRTAIGAVAGSIGALVVLGVVAQGAIAALAAQALARAGGRATSLPPAFLADTLASLWARFGWANV